MTLVKLKDAATDAERRAAIAAALKATGGDKAGAAAVLGISRTHLYRQLGPDHEAEESLVLLSVKVPLRCMEWLDLEAVRRKHAGGAAHAPSP